MKTILAAAALAATLATPALAQTYAAPPAGPVGVVPGPATTGGVLAPQGGSTGAPGAYNYSPTGQPADVISNDSSAAGNAGQPSRVAPQGGGGSSR